MKKDLKQWIIIGLLILNLIAVIYNIILTQKNQYEITNSRYIDNKRGVEMLNDIKSEVNSIYNEIWYR